MKKSVLSWLVIAIAIIAGIVAYPGLPEQMAIHWDMNNAVDEFAHKAFALFLLPGLMVILMVILPRKQNYQKHKSSIQIVQNVVLLSLLILHGAIIAYGYGLEIKMANIALPMVGIIFAATGNYMPRFQPNSYIGIKTIHTLTNETVWRKTHQAAAKFFVIGGLLMVGTAFIPAPLQMIIFFSLVVIVILASVYLSFHYAKDSE